jgi:prepilin-type N-terminal cleavage/methylation domain-containing protein
MRLKIAVQNKKGLTLLEVLVAVFILAIIALPLLNMFVYNTSSVRLTANLQDTTYLAQAVMEDLQPLGYNALYSAAPTPGASPTSYQIKSVVNSSTVYYTKLVTIDRIPYGSFNSLVTGTACYAHLIVSGTSLTFTCPDGKAYSVLSSSAITVGATKVTIGASEHDLNKPTGTNMILIINAGSSAISALTITLPSDKSVPYVLYALAPTDAKVQAITVNNGSTASKEYRKFNSTTDLPPTYMLVNVLCKVYKDSSTVESMVQDTLRVNLP